MKFILFALLGMLLSTAAIASPVGLNTNLSPRGKPKGDKGTPSVGLDDDYQLLNTHKSHDGLEKVKVRPSVDFAVTGPVIPGEVKENGGKSKSASKSHKHHYDTRDLPNFDNDDDVLKRFKGPMVPGHARDANSGDAAQVLARGDGLNSESDDVSAPVAKRTMDPGVITGSPTGGNGGKGKPKLKTKSVAARTEWFGAGGTVSHFAGAGNIVGAAVDGDKAGSSEGDEGRRDEGGVGQGHQ